MVADIEQPPFLKSLHLPLPLHYFILIHGGFEPSAILSELRTYFRLLWV